MGIDYSSKMLVVWDGDVIPLLEEMLELEEYEDCNDVNDLMDELGLDSASPWCDSPQDAWVIGFRIYSPSYEQLLDQESEWWVEFNGYVDKLVGLFGEGDISLQAHHHIF
jgi:hypothetical protein